MFIKLFTFFFLFLGLISLIAVSKGERYSLTSHLILTFIISFIYWLISLTMKDYKYDE